MKTLKQELKEKSISYGLQSLSNEELIKLIGFKGEDFYTSHEFKAMKEAVRRTEIKEQFKIKTSKDAYTRLSFLENTDHEQFWCIYLRNNNTIIKEEFISKGGLTGTVADCRIILKNAIILKATAIVLSHNHPSGNLQPSSADITLTKNIQNGAKFLDIIVVDHVIVGNGNFYSFADNGIL